MAKAPEYSFYVDTYGGRSIEGADWKRYAVRAAAYLTRLEALCTVTPYGNGEDSVSLAVCAVADEMHGFDEAERRASVSSASIGSVSTSYDATKGGSIDLSPQGRELAMLRAASSYVHVFAGVR